MSNPPNGTGTSGRGHTRRGFLADCGLGFTGLAMGAMLARDGVVRASTPRSSAEPDGLPHFPPRAKHVIWFFMLGGVSHMESFDPKPGLTRFGGKSISETPYKHVIDNPLVRKNVREFIPGRRIFQTLYPLQIGFQKRGRNGIEVSDWFPHLGGQVDKLAIIRSMWTTDNDHAAQYQFHTGRHIFDGSHPSIGSWIHYGLGSLNDDLPSFVAIGDPPSSCCGGNQTHSASYLGPMHSAVQLGSDPANPLPFAAPGVEVNAAEQQSEARLLARLNGLTAQSHPEDSALKARVLAYEMAFRMQSSVPEVFRFSEEREETRRLYGLDQAATRPFAQHCLMARRLVERGVRFVQVYHGHNGGAGEWDAHGHLREGHSKLAKQVDQPIAGLLIDLQRRGLLDETIVVFATEFGRTPGIEFAPGANSPRDGRDHHPYGFSVWMSGAGIRGGVAHGATDELGFHAVEHRHYVTDVHATVSRLLGLDPRRLEVPGRKRLDIDFGSAIEPILA